MGPAWQRLTGDAGAAEARGESAVRAKGERAGWAERGEKLGRGVGRRGKGKVGQRVGLLGCLVGLSPDGVFYFLFSFSFPNYTQVYLNSNKL